MPTKKKRVGFIPREEVMKIIDKLSLENNLSNSKVINFLVEEALSSRGIYRIKRDNINRNANLLIKLNPEDEIVNNNIIDPANLEIKRNESKIEDKLDIQTYEKFLLFLKFQEISRNYN